MSEVFRPLPEPGQLVLDEPNFSYPSAVAAGGGRAHLRVWDCGDGGHAKWLAVVTEIEDGATVTNSAAEIWALLVQQHGPELVLLEYYNAGSHSGPDHLDQVAILGSRRPTWRRVWPTSTSNPDHEAFTAWMQRHAHQLPHGDGTSAAR